MTSLKAPQIIYMYTTSSDTNCTKSQMCTSLTCKCHEENLPGISASFAHSAVCPSKFMSGPKGWWSLLKYSGHILVLHIVSVCWYMSWATKRLWKSTRQCQFGLITESQYARFGYIALIYVHCRELVNVVDKDLKWSLPYMMKVIKLGSLWMTLARLYNCYLIVFWLVCDYFHIM
jgi:hypothetical protein